MTIQGTDLVSSYYLDRLDKNVTNDEH
jgi:hypothetical protein